MNGIGNVTSQLLESVDVKTCGDLYEKRALLYWLFSEKSFSFFIKVYKPLIIITLLGLSRFRRRNPFCLEGEKVDRQATHFQKRIG